MRVCLKQHLDHADLGMVETTGRRLIPSL